MKAYLILDDGSVFPGERFGSPKEVICEMVFNTGLTGYLELLTDASYAGQGIIMASPIIGNYGVFTEQSESDRPWADALIVRDLTNLIGDVRDSEDLNDYLIRHDIPGISGIDTRSLILTLREKGTMNGMITVGTDYDLKACLTRIHAYTNPCPVARVSRKTAKTYESGAFGRINREPGMSRPLDILNEIPYEIDPAVTAKYKIAMLDFGLKQNIIWNLTRRNCEVTVYPWDTPADVILAAKPDGVMLSNGPGDPVDCEPIIPNIRALYESGVIVFGICLGHQLVALATGAKTRKLKYGHRGINHPVKDLAADRVYITSQNHGYVVIDETVDNQVAEVSHVHVNDGSCEGLRYKQYPVFTVQYHPEGAPGPQDSEYLFDEFLSRIDQNRGQNR
ncbi:MAG: carbamoyl phosphate synthase small subunit [Eubacteriales bacterium]|nr:carbamoyl phosphate synthase small subunit [Eubacteriales bacterium]